MGKMKTKNRSNETLNIKKTLAENKRVRLSSALRDNLSKRKKQARGRAFFDVTNLKDSEN
jgi:hypothetical protein